MSVESDRLYKEGVAAIRAGDKVTARNRLMQVVELDQTHEQAWLWLSAAVEGDEDRIICLQNVLTINPNNEAARKGLIKLGGATAIDTNAAGFSEELPVAEQPAPEPSYRLEHASSRIAESLQLSGAEREILGSGGKQPETAARSKNALPPEESWRAGLVAESNAAVPNSAKFLRDDKGAREPRGFLDLVSTWGELLLFNTGSEFRKEYRNAGFAHILINIVVAAILAGILSFLGILITDTTTPGGIEGYFRESMSSQLPPGESIPPEFEEILAFLGSPQFMGIGMAVMAVAFIPGFFLATMFESFFLDQVSSRLGGNGDIIQTQHAITNVLVVQQIARIPVIFLTPFLPATAAFYLSLAIGLYPFLLKARAVGEVHGFGLLIGIGAIIINAFVMGVVLSLLFGCFFFLLIFGSGGGS